MNFRKAELNSTHLNSMKAQLNFMKAQLKTYNTAEFIKLQQKNIYVKME